MAKKKVLQDHVRRGKVFLPPFTRMLGSLQEISWVKIILPELLWIALIQEHHGHREGVGLITSVARRARACSPSPKPRIFGTITSFAEMTTDQQSCLRKGLAASGELFKIEKALFPMVSFYPECPLAFLFSGEANQQGASLEHLKRPKILVDGLYNRCSKDTMMVQATMIWLAFDSEALKVCKGLALASFPEIEKYPQTELSEKVAASIRASIHVLFGHPHYPVSTHWPHYFWNRGLQIDQCCFEEALDD